MFLKMLVAANKVCFGDYSMTEIMNSSPIYQQGYLISRTKGCLPAL